MKAAASNPAFMRVTAPRVTITPIMKKIGAVLLVLLAIAPGAFAEKFLSVSDIHFNPFADPTLVTKLEAADVAQWSAILASSSITAFSAYGSDVNDPLLRSAIDRKSVV